MNEEAVDLLLVKNNADDVALTLRALSIGIGSRRQWNRTVDGAFPSARPL